MSLSALEQLERGQRVVVVIGERIADRRLVAVITGEMKHVVEIGIECGEDRVVRDRSGNETHDRIVRHVNAIRRQEIVDNGQPARAFL